MTAMMATGRFYLFFLHFYTLFLLFFSFCDFIKGKKKPNKHSSTCKLLLLTFCGFKLYFFFCFSLFIFYSFSFIHFFESYGKTIQVFCLKFVIFLGLKLLFVIRYVKQCLFQHLLFHFYFFVLFLIFILHFLLFSLALAEFSEPQ